MYKTVLVAMALDHNLSPQLLASARSLCAEGGSITALHVIEEPGGAAGAAQHEDLRRAALENANTLIGTKLADYPEIEAKVLYGHVSRTLLDYAAELGADCIIMGSHRPGLLDYLIGSTAARVVRHATCSVHVSRQG